MTPPKQSPSRCVEGSMGFRANVLRGGDLDVAVACIVAAADAGLVTVA